MTKTRQDKTRQEQEQEQDKTRQGITPYVGSSDEVGP